MHISGMILQNCLLFPLKSTAVRHETKKNINLSPLLLYRIVMISLFFEEKKTFGTLPKDKISNRFPR